MRQNSNDFRELNIICLVGDTERLAAMRHLRPLEPFCEQIKEFLDVLSKELRSDLEAKAYPDVMTFAFWIRKASVEDLKNRFATLEKCIYRVGRGVAFHIAPSNVPVNYAYSLVTGLLCGNANIVRIPSKEFRQVTIINRAIENALKKCPIMAPYIALVRYGHNEAINDLFSAMADVRIVWGGDETIAELRKSALGPRATEITFSDRYSLVMIDAETYLAMDEAQVAKDFYNDTYLTDQNACTAPRIVAWIGIKLEEAKNRFWDALYQLVQERYEIQGVQAVNKLTSSYLLAVAADGVKKVSTVDNRLVRMQVETVSSELIEFKDNSGYFFETNCNTVEELFDVCDDTRCQTLSYIGDKAMFLPLLELHPRGIDRIVPVGKTMDFDLLWDGYNLYERLTRTIFMH